MPRAYQAMGLEDYRLSAAVVEETECNGDPILDQDRTMDLRTRAQYFMRLVPETNQDGKKQLTSRLQSLTVWGATAIKLKRRINDIKGIEDSGDIVFKEKSTQLDIYIPIDIENQSVFVYQLSENLIKHCGITDSRHQKLVQPILSAPISTLLEQFDLDGHLEADARSSLLGSFFDSVEAQDPGNTFRTSTASYSASRFKSTANETVFTSGLLITGGVSSLRASIPTLDQSIASVRQAAASEDRSSSFTVFGPQITTQNISASSTTEHSDIRDDVGFVDELTDLNLSSNRRVRGINDDEDGEGGVFGVAALRSALSEVTESCPRMSFGGSRFTGSPSHNRSQGRYYAGPVDEASSLQSLHHRHVGLLGKTFIYEHFSTRLPNWGASNWTSKNRVEAGHPPFTELERDYADFTYVDSGWALTTFLSQIRCKMTGAWPRSEKAPTYHLEVKSTTEKCDEPFYMSNNQVEKARGYKLSVSIVTPLDVYVILRVYDLQKPGLTPRFVAYVDPWSMYLQQSLILRAWDKFVVTPN